MRTGVLLSLPTVCVGALSADGTRARAGVASASLPSEFATHVVDRNGGGEWAALAIEAALPLQRETD